MSLKKNIIQIWKAKGQILEGVANSIFKKEDDLETLDLRQARTTSKSFVPMLIGKR